MSAPSTSGLSVGLLLRVIDVKYGCLLYFTLCPEANAIRYFAFIGSISGTHPLFNSHDLNLMPQYVCGMGKMKWIWDS